MVPDVRTVLLVEDDRAWAMLTREAFTEAAPGVSVEWCSTGRAALVRVEAQPWPDAVLLDLNLPDLDGLEVLEALRALPASRRPVVVVLSASRAASDRSAVARHGAEHREKPTTFSELRDLVGDIASGAVGTGVAPEPDASAEHVRVERPLRGPEEP